MNKISNKLSPQDLDNTWCCDHDLARQVLARIAANSNLPCLRQEGNLLYVWVYVLGPKVSFGQHTQLQAVTGIF